ncbi:MAG: class I SAM-dependent methyltransferase [Sedimentisphaerales bacterium]|nr:class I SAM-dependent methyltransferase [Sedimentisphaerales bacterium]
MAEIPRNSADLTSQSNSPDAALDNTTELYSSDKYITHYPTLFTEHSAWKMTKLCPPLDIWHKQLATSTQQVGLLDVGGGAGLILKATAEHIQKAYGCQVRKYALDLSPAMLETQRQNNPDLIEALQQDITATGFPDKTFDLTLMIDVLEHVPDPEAVLRELKRISHYVLLKVPLEDHLVNRLSDFLNRGQTRRSHREILGHVNFYTASSLRRQLTGHLGRVLHFDYTNAFEFTLRSEPTQPKAVLRLVNRLCRGLYRFSPRVASGVFTDFAVVLVCCNP